MIWLYGCKDIVAYKKTHNSRLFTCRVILDSNGHIMARIKQRCQTFWHEKIDGFKSIGFRIWLNHIFAQRIWSWARVCLKCMTSSLIETFQIHKIIHISKLYLQVNLIPNQQLLWKLLLITHNNIQTHYNFSGTNNIPHNILTYFPHLVSYFVEYLPVPQNIARWICTMLRMGLRSQVHLEVDVGYYLRHIHIQ